MSGDCPMEFLKSQTVVARAWVLAHTEKKHTAYPVDRCNDDGPGLSLELDPIGLDDAVAVEEVVRIVHLENRAVSSIFRGHGQEAALVGTKIP